MDLTELERKLEANLKVLYECALVMKLATIFENKVMDPAGLKKYVNLYTLEPFEQILTELSNTLSQDRGKSSGQEKEEIK